MELKLSEYREKARFTQQEVASIAGVSSKTEWNWEQGKSYPNAYQLCLIAVALKCTPNDLCGWYDTHPREVSPGLTHDEEILVSDYRDLTPERKRSIASNARDLAEVSRATRKDGESAEAEELSA